jgi:hypothetical protein
VTGTYRNGILGDPLDIDAPPMRRKEYPAIAAEPGVDIAHTATGTIGHVIEWSPEWVGLRDESGRDHRYRNIAGSFTVDGRPVRLTQPSRPDAAPSFTASGSVAGAPSPARLARAGRILVEGIHDAELVEKVWGDDLRSEGIVVESMDGADDLAAVVRAFRPGDRRRLGVLLDHLVADTKESRLAEGVDDPHVMICGHTFVDVWAAVHPRVVGLERWPDIPHGRSWKDGVVAEVAATGTLDTGGDVRRFWRELLGRVESFRDLDPSLVGAVERLIDFVAVSD